MHMLGPKHTNSATTGRPSVVPETESPFVDSGCEARGCVEDGRYGFCTRRLLVTGKVPGTLLARIPTRFLSASLSTTPSNVTRPMFTLIRIGFCTPSAYFSSAG